MPAGHPAFNTFYSLFRKLNKSFAGCLSDSRF
jgi:hypothetical protein